MTAQSSTATKTRGEGPAMFAYSDKAGKSDYSRVPADVAAIIVKSRAKGTVKSYDISKLPDSVKNNLVAYAVASMMKTQINNHADPSADVTLVSDAKFADLLAGKVYAGKAEGSKPGKVFDPSIYMEAMRLAIKEMADRKMVNGKTSKPYKPMSDKDVADFKALLMGLTPKERTAKINGAKANNFFKKNLLMLQAKAAGASDEQVDLSF